VDTESYPEGPKLAAVRRHWEEGQEVASVITETRLSESFAPYKIVWVITKVIDKGHTMYSLYRYYKMGIRWVGFMEVERRRSIYHCLNKLTEAFADSYPEGE
jgi:hypothetical protein